jgi:ATP-dependent exoDNAse (exonuclease V) beta subunit
MEASRLLYVAATRPERHLHLLAPLHVRHASLLDCLALSLYSCLNGLTILASCPNAPKSLAFRLT